MSLGFRIEGTCPTCKWEWYGRIDNQCEMCYCDRNMIHAFLLTTLAPDVKDKHLDSDDPLPRRVVMARRYGNKKPTKQQKFNKRKKKRR